MKDSSRSIYCGCVFLKTKFHNVEQIRAICVVAGTTTCCGGWIVCKAANWTYLQLCISINIIQIDSIQFNWIQVQYVHIFHRCRCAWCIRVAFLALIQNKKTNGASNSFIQMAINNIVDAFFPSSFYEIWVFSQNVPKTTATVARTQQIWSENSSKHGMVRYKNASMPWRFVYISSWNSDEVYEWVRCAHSSPFRTMQCTNAFLFSTLSESECSECQIPSSFINVCACMCASFKPI